MTSTRRFGIVGAGFSGAVVARELAEAGHRIDVYEARPHVAGNAHTTRDAATGVMVHVYGPHIFHTDNERVWAHVRRFGAMRPYNHKVKAVVRGRVYSLPVNLHTINQFFGTALSPREAQALLEAKADRSIREPRTFEEQALRFVGAELYQAFFEGYTRKQWGLDPSQLPASILKRLPLRFNYDDSYFAHPHQAIPEDGYTRIVERMLDHPNIVVHLSTVIGPSTGLGDHVFWSGCLDEWFGFALGRLRYRTLDFESSVEEGDHQGIPVLNQCDANVPFTRTTEHKHFAPWERHERSVVYREFSRACEPTDIPYYPVRLADDEAVLLRYLEQARLAKGVTFLGRLGTYRYLDMDVTIREALNVADAVKQAIAQGTAFPVYAADLS